MILADRATVQLNPERVTTDVREFESALGAAARAGSPAERARWLTEAVGLYQGELLPGCSEPWVVLNRERTAGLFLQALAQLVRLLPSCDDRPLEIVGLPSPAEVDGFVPVTSPDPSSVAPQWKWLRMLAAHPTPLGRTGLPLLDQEDQPLPAREPATVAALLLRQLHQSRELERQLRQLLVEITPASTASDAREDRCGAAAAMPDAADRN